MKSINRFLFVLILFCYCSLLYAVPPITKVVFFGDSLSDNGNLSKISLGILPKSPPYFNGRFSNGPTWAERVGKELYKKYNIDYSVYAVGGGTAAFHRPTFKFISLFTLGLQIDAYLVDSLFKDRSNVLYVIWIGANDCVFGPNNQDVNILANQVVNKIYSAVDTLRKWGGRNFLVLNLPDLSRTPHAENDPNFARYRLLTELYNENLALNLKAFQKNYPEVNMIDFNIYEVFLDAIQDPTKYNKKYHLHITNTSDACWRGGFLFLKNNAETLEDEIRTAIIQKQSRVPLNLMRENLEDESPYTNSKYEKNIDPEVLANFIMSTPTAATAYNVGKMYAAGMRPCDNPDEYIFWDSLHPTNVVHQILGHLVVDKLVARYHLDDE